MSVIETYITKDVTMNNDLNPAAHPLLVVAARVDYQSCVVECIGSFPRPPNKTRRKFMRFA